MIYIVVSNQSIQGFVDEVNNNITKGFVPIGGATSIPVAGGTEVHMVQAMINDKPLKVLSEEFKIIEKGIVPGEKGPEYLFIYQYKRKQHKVNLGQGLRNYTDEELKTIALG